MTRGLPLALLLLVSLSALAEDKDRTHFLWPMEVRAGETAPNAVCVACSIQVRGRVSGNAVVAWGEIVVEGEVAGNAISALGGIRVLRGGKIGGDAVSFGVAVQKDPQGLIRGKIEEKFALPNRWWLFAALVAFNLALVALMLVGLRKRLERIADALARHPAWTAMTGVVALGLAFGVLELSERLGDWEDAISLGVCIVVCLASLPGYAGLSLWTGRRFLQQTPFVRATLLGALWISILQLIPVAGPLFLVISFTLALGAGITGAFGFARPAA